MNAEPRDALGIGRTCGARALVFCLVGLLATSGCDQSGGRVHVAGRLTANGSPVDHATLLFTPVSPSTEPSAGKVGADGSFTLFGPRSLKKGAFPGEYTVWISRPILPDGRPLLAAAGGSELPEPAYDSIPKKYSGRDTTVLKISIPPTGGPLTIDLPEGLLDGPEKGSKR